ADKALRESQARLAGIVNSAMDAIITVDDNQHVMLFNGSAERMFECSAEEAIVKSLMRFIPEGLRAGHQDHVRDFGRTNISKRSMGTLGAIFGVRANGEEFPIEASISQQASEGQNFFTVILRD